MINLLKVALTPGAPEELREEREIEPLSLSHIEWLRSATQECYLYPLEGTGMYSLVYCITFSKNNIQYIYIHIYIFTLIWGSIPNFMLKQSYGYHRKAWRMHLLDLSAHLRFQVIGGRWRSLKSFGGQILISTQPRHVIHF